MNPPTPPPPVPTEPAAVQAAEEIVNMLARLEDVPDIKWIAARIQTIAIDPLRAELERDLNRVRNLAAEDSMAEQRKRIIAESALTAERAKVRELVESLRDVLFAAQNADETGYVTDVGFISIDAIQEQAHHLLARHSAAPPTGTGLKEEEAG